MKVLGMDIPCMTPGAIWLRLRQRFAHGPRVAWYRDVVRPRILRTAPVADTTDKSCEVHVLTSADDWLNLIWTLKSFYAVSPVKYALCIHADKTVSPRVLATLQSHFPEARVISRAEADAKLTGFLKDYPGCLHFRNTNLLAPKVFDFLAFLESDRMALFDSDLMFFAKPTAYLQLLEDGRFQKNAFNSDFGSAYTVDPDTVRQLFDFELHPKVNSGLGLVHRASLRLDWIEEFLKLPGILEGHFWRIEQTIYALCSSRFGVELLPEPYTLYLDPGLGGRPFRHYNGCIRHLMYVEGMQKLQREGFLQNGQ